MRNSEENEEVRMKNEEVKAMQSMPGCDLCPVLHSSFLLLTFLPFFVPSATAVKLRCAADNFSGDQTSRADERTRRFVSARTSLLRRR
jgi:hypothetical protein